MVWGSGFMSQGKGYQVPMLMVRILAHLLLATGASKPSRPSSRLAAGETTPPPPPPLSRCPEGRDCVRNTCSSCVRNKPSAPGGGRSVRDVIMMGACGSVSDLITLLVRGLPRAKGSRLSASENPPRGRTTGKPPHDSKLVPSVSPPLGSTLLASENPSLGSRLFASENPPPSPS